MKRELRFIICMSIISMMLLVTCMTLLKSIEPLQQHQTARSVVIHLYNMDPKVQRDTASGTLQIQPEQFATNTLQYVNQYMYIPISILALSIALTFISLFILRRNRKVSGNLFMLAAATSCFTIIPPLLQVISGSMLLKEKSRGDHLKVPARSQPIN